MKIPISNTLLKKVNNVSNVKKMNAKIFNENSFYKVNKKQFPSINLIKKILNSGSSSPTIVNAANEVLVDLFLSNKIGFLDIVKTTNKIFKDKEFKKYAKRKVKSIKDIKIVDNWARLKTVAICVK